MIFLITLLLTVAAHEGRAEDGPECKSAMCEETGKRIAEFMDKDPKYCEDFHQSACGGFLENEKFPESNGGIYLRSKLEENILNEVQNILEETPGPGGNLFTLMKNMYKLCKENDKTYNQMIETVRTNLQDVGDWPLFNDEWTDDSWKFEDIEIKMRNKGFQYNSLVHIKVVQDLMIPQRYVLQVLPGERWMSLVDLQSRNEDYDKYKKNMINIAKLLRESDDETAAKNYAENTLEFYMKLVKMAEQNSKVVSQGKVYTVKDLSTEVPQIDWMKLLKGLINGITKLEETDEVYIKDLQYLKSLDNLLNVHRKESANVILWQAVRKLIKIHGLPSKNSQTDKKLEDDDDDEEDSEQKSGEGSENHVESNVETVETQCSVEIYNKLTLAVSYFYVKKHFTKATREEATKIVDHIKEELLHYIDGLQWMKDDSQPTTREQAKEKIKNMKVIVGHHDELEDIKNVDSVYEGLKIEHNNYAAANMAWNKWSTDLMFKKLGMKVADTKFWDNNSIWIRKFYNPYDNSLAIPAGSIQPPFFSPEVPKYVNYAIFGRMIGEQITGAIVNEGKHYNPSGLWFGDSWWSSDTKKEQEKIKRCFEGVYRGYMCRTGEYVNSIDTSSNNMADQGAVKLAYNAYKKNFPDEKEKLPHVPPLSTNQMFWLAGAHVWCSKMDDSDIRDLVRTYRVAPPEIRVNAAYGLMPQFHNDFGCESKPTTEAQSSQPAQKNPLYPENQCELW